MFDALSTAQLEALTGSLSKSIHDLYVFADRVSFYSPFCANMIHDCQGDLFGLWRRANAEYLARIGHPEPLAKLLAS